MPWEYEDAFLLESSSLFSYFRFVLLPDLGGVAAAAFAITFSAELESGGCGIDFPERSSVMASLACTA